jgi:hypothetical protein
MNRRQGTRQAAVTQTDERAAFHRLQVDFDQRAFWGQFRQRGEVGVMGFPSPGECDAARRAYFDIAAARNIAGAHLDAENATLLRIENAGPNRRIDGSPSRTS